MTKYMAFYASMNGDSGKRECATEAEARYWESLWIKSGGRIANVTTEEGEIASPGREIPLMRYGEPVATR